MKVVNFENDVKRLQIRGMTMMLFSKLLVAAAVANLILYARISSASTFVKSYCSNLEYGGESWYGDNLKDLLSDMGRNAKQSTNNGYYATNTSALDTTIYGAFLCRGDIEADDCRVCVSQATNKVTTECPSDKQAVIWFDTCMLRYSNESFLGNVDETCLVYRSQQVFDDDVDKKMYMTVAGNELKSLANQMNTEPRTMPGDKKYFLTKNSSVNGFTNMYTMAQCTPDIQQIACTSCLQRIIGDIQTNCYGYMGCRMLNPSCFVRYERYIFALSNSFQPLPSPPPQPPNISAVPTTPPSTETRNTSHESQALNIALGSLVVLVVLLVAAFFVLLCRKRSVDNEVQMNRTRSREPDHGPRFEHGNGTSVESLQFDLVTLEAATNNFSDENKIGEGGFGDVFKGTLSNGKEIAVKRSFESSGQSLEQFRNEVVLVAKFQHRNLVQLLGYCFTSNEMLLVYEFVCNKSLDLILFDPEKRGHLDWFARYKIINGIARGLGYIHEDSRHKVIHRDLKASNVLLDADMSPKIADFGLARKFRATQLEEHTDRVAGTRGYMAPEYMEYGAISTKSDVYSFGVLVLEIISGKKISDRHLGQAENLLAYAWKHWNDDTITTFVDASIKESCSIAEVKRCIHLGLLCVQGDTEQRPTMVKIISYLNADIDLPTPQQPAFVASRKIGLSSGTPESHSHRSHRSGSSSRTNVSGSNLSTNKSTQSFPGDDG